MRIGLVCPYAWDVPGGVQVHVRDLAEEFLRLGHWVTVLAPAEDDEHLPEYVVNAGRPIAVPYNGSVAKINFGPGPLSRAREWIRTSDLDVMHVHEPLTPGLSMLSIWAARGPIVATWHSSIEKSRALSAAYFLAQTVMEKISGRIAVSELARGTLVDHLGGDAVLIPNGVNCRKYEHSDLLPGWPGDGGAVMFLGRIDEPRKGLPVLVGALPAIVAGASRGSRHRGRPRRHRGRAEGPAAGPAGADRRSSASPPRRTRSAAYHSVDLYVAPNTGGETFGIVLLEAMASRTAVLASDLDSFARVLDDGAAGDLFRNDDSADLAAKANALLSDEVRASNWPTPDSSGPGSSTGGGSQRRSWTSTRP